ncbi:hypothetical protein QYE76_035157 [Lolium multiflorum]|uniref:RING-type E3 ubiquitin transferase n=1 Tax=Lolium multiflorum TaxID=4521 RepID=A0AAD8R118_LOLMU|nr:hypothetical protein QYE76_035157 [Lolium multiflorum]
MAAFAADEFFLDIDEDGPGALGEASYFSFSEEEHQFIHSDIAPGFDIETLTPTPGGSPFSFDSDRDLAGLSPPRFHMRSAISPSRSRSRSPPFWDCLEDDLGDNLADHIDDVLEWEEIPDSANDADDAAVPIGTGGTVRGQGEGIGEVDPDVFGFFSERDILGVMEGIDSGDESLFSDEPPFNFGDLDDEGQEIDDMFRSVGWEEVIPAALDDDDEFEVLPGHMVDAAVGGAPPAARAAVEQLQVAVIGGEDAAQGCAVCKDGIVQGELATRLPCAHFYHGDCIGPWLAIRNSCPVCRYELPTDDPDYEKQRARRCSAGASVGSPMHI